MPSDSLNRLLIKKPWISEKATDLGALRKYVFLLHPRANKKQVKELVEDLYGVRVKSVNIIRVRNKGESFKKAVVTLQEGDAIDIVPH